MIVGAVKRYAKRKRKAHVSEQVKGSLAGYYDKPVVRRKMK